MVWIINQRTDGHAGDIARADCWATGGGAAPKYDPVPADVVAARAAGLQVVVAIHGFNVNRPDAVRAYVTLEARLGLDPNTHLFVGVCWPGDGIVPIINYSWESKDAMSCGGYLADYLDTAMPDAAGFSFVSHSLGGRVLLQAVRKLGRTADEVCITAGAVDDDCLVREFSAVTGKARRVSVLSSRRDPVLRLAYPLGDFVTDVFLGGKDSPWHGALGLGGPNPKGQPRGVQHWPIDRASRYGHGDYFPPSAPGPPAVGKWERSVAYMGRAIRGAPNSW